MVHTRSLHQQRSCCEGGLPEVLARLSMSTSLIVLLMIAFTAKAQALLSVCLTNEALWEKPKYKDSQCLE